jgi:hypothetical protein
VGGAVGAFVVVGGAVGALVVVGGAVGAWVVVGGAVGAFVVVGGAVGALVVVGGAVGAWVVVGGAVGALVVVGGAVGALVVVGGAVVVTGATHLQVSSLKRPPFGHPPMGIFSLHTTWHSLSSQTLLSGISVERWRISKEECLERSSSTHLLALVLDICRRKLERPSVS